MMDAGAQGHCPGLCGRLCKAQLGCREPGQSLDMGNVCWALWFAGQECPVPVEGAVSDRAAGGEALETLVTWGLLFVCLFPQLP